LVRTVCVLSGLVAFATLAQPEVPSLEHDLQSWTLLTAWGRRGTFRWYAEAQPRVSLSTGRFERLLLRPAVGVQVTPETSLWVGYAWTPTFGPYSDEQRPFQQLLVEHRLGPVTLANRLRVEERFIADTSGVSVRARHMVRAIVRFGPSSPLGVAASEEVFVTLTASARGPMQGFDQNRAFIGLNWRRADWQVELGYMNVFVDRPAPSGDRMLHSVAAMVVFTAP
jgi:hypothetical protein